MPSYLLELIPVGLGLLFSSRDGGVCRGTTVNLMEATLSDELNWC